MWGSASPRRASRGSRGSLGGSVDAATASSEAAAFDLLFPRRPASKSKSAVAGPAHGPRGFKDELWTFVPPSASDASPPGSPAASDKTNASSSAGAIGSSRARLVWNRVAPEEEEREEEALPAYLSYAQPAFAGLSAAAAPFQSERFPPFGPAPSVSPPPFALGDEHAEPSAHVEEKTRELAQALQELIRSQLAPPEAPVSSASAVGCDCGPLRSRVSELEGQVAAMQAQMARLLDGSVSPASGGGEAAAGSPGVGLSDRISTLEGRQSAFQSQLAQIARVLGVPVGKHGKNSPLKTLVQSLHDRIDERLAAAEAQWGARAGGAVEDAQDAPDAEASDAKSERTSTTSSVSNDLDTAPSPSTTAVVPPPSTPQSTTSLPMAAVLSALAEEHEASLAKVSGYFEDRLLQEGKHRVALEARVHARLAQQEEWLQQLEGEVSLRYDAAASTAAQVTQLAAQMQTLSVDAKVDDKPGSKKRGTTSPSASGSSSSTAAAAASSPASTVAANELAAMRSALQQLQTLVKQQQGELKSEASVRRDAVLLVETQAQAARDETRALAATSKGLKLLVEKLVRDTGSAEELLQQYVSTITHQVASVTRQYVGARLRDNNRLIDATLRARVPAYAANDSERFVLVQPETEADAVGAGAAGTVLREADVDADALRRFLPAPPPSPSTTSNGKPPPPAASAGRKPTPSPSQT